ncbi:hypothetical protein ATCC90586_000505 [Pythium insidiosum]|nr:hypothetical protein ATCC90586_000505 [Pythium insidiosum]
MPTIDIDANSLLAQHVCNCDECPHVSAITELVALAFAADAHNRSRAVATHSVSPRAEHLLVWLILRALCVYNESRAPRSADVGVVTRALRRCAHDPLFCYDVNVCSVRPDLASPALVRLALGADSGCRVNVAALVVDGGSSSKLQRQRDKSPSPSLVSSLSPRR